MIDFADSDARHRLLTDLDTTFFVEAGAGTGKTTMLVSRIVELIAAGPKKLRMERLAAITFTEAAAAELRDRIRQELEKAALKRTGPDANYLQKASREVDLASIQTIHAFAGALLRTYPLEAHLPPNFAMLDEIQQERGFGDRFRAWLYDEVPDPAYPQRRAAVRRVLALGMTPDQIRELATRLEDHRDLIDAETVWPVPDLEDAASVANDWGSRLKDLECEADRALDRSDKLVAELRRLQVVAQRMVDVRDQDEALRLLQQCKPRYSDGNQENWPPGLCKEIKSVLKECSVSTLETLNAHRAAALAEVLLYLRDLTLDSADKRLNDGESTFHDLLVRARDLLRDNPAVRRRAQARFDRVFVDEFQDTDPLQVEIAWFLTARSDQAEERDWKKLQLEPGKLFIVGDPKQSIYRFRRADIGIYHQVYARLEHESDRVVLSQSFRSPAPLVDWFNFHFEDDMRFKDGVQPAYARLDPRPPDATSPGSDFGVRHFGHRVETAGERSSEEARTVVPPDATSPGSDFGVRHFGHRVETAGERTSEEAKSVVPPDGTSRGSDFGERHVGHRVETAGERTSEEAKTVVPPDGTSRGSDFGVRHFGHRVETAGERSSEEAKAPAAPDGTSRGSDFGVRHFGRGVETVGERSSEEVKAAAAPDGTSRGSDFGVRNFGHRVETAGERWSEEAKAVAQLAHQMVNGTHPLTDCEHVSSPGSERSEAGEYHPTWYVADQGMLRPARYNDICVLIPTRTNLRRLERAFQNADVPYRIESGWLVLHTQEVRDLLSCLRAIDDPSDQVALVAALRSPAYACSDVDLLRWVDSGGRLDYEWPGGGCDGPVLRALTSLREFHTVRMDRTPAATAEEFIRDRMLAVQAFGSTHPRDSLRRLRYVVAQARTLAGSGQPTLRALCDWLESRQREQYYDAESAVPDSDEDAVRFMTVHGSKGLEFPIVILTGLGVATSRVGPQSVDLVPNYKTNVLEVRCGEFTTANYVRNTEKSMYEAEQKRLLYVATTRARDHLVLSLYHGKDPCHASRILARLASRPELSRELRVCTPPQVSAAAVAPSPASATAVAPSSAPAAPSPTPGVRASSPTTAPRPFPTANASAPSPSTAEATPFTEFADPAATAGVDPTAAASADPASGSTAPTDFAAAASADPAVGSTAPADLAAAASADPAVGSTAPAELAAAASADPTATAGADPTAAASTDPAAGSTAPPDLAAVAGADVAAAAAQHKADEDAWLSNREAVIAALSNQKIISPSHLAHEPPQADPDPPPEPDPNTVPRRIKKGRGGSALGRAVHAVLQSIDLATLADLEQLAESAATEENVPDSVDQLKQYVRHAAASGPVQRALASTRYWREIPVGVSLANGALLEGAIDLLYEDADGSLVVVDYKTDQVPPDRLPARLDQYRSQGEAYALAIFQATSQRVTRIEFIFVAASPDHAEVIVLDHPDLQRAAAAVDNAALLLTAG